MIVMTFYSFGSFNIWTWSSSGIKNKEGGLYFWHRRFGGIDSPKKQKKKPKQLWW